MQKILILHNIITPIRIFLFNELKKHFDKKNIQMFVIFLSRTNKIRLWKIDNNIKFNYYVSKNFVINLKGKDLHTFFINKEIYKEISKFNPDKIISFGWNNWAAYAAAHWCRKNNKKFILWSGSTKYEKSWRRSLLKPMVKYIINRSNGFITYGKRAKDYLISLGAPKEKIQIFYNTIDIDYFRGKYESFNEEEKKKLKEKLNIKTDKIILFSGQLIERKGTFELLGGFKEYQKKYPNASLIMIGEGREKLKLKEIVKKEKIKNVYLPGFIPYSKLYKYYSIADIFILPSRKEVWGLAINEALACDLPIITTKETGAGADLVEENKNGYIIQSNSPEEITRAIQKVFKNNLHKNNNSWQIIQKTRAENILEKIDL